MNISNVLCDLYDIKNMAKLNGFGNLPKDNEGTELTISDCIDSCIEELEKTKLNYLFKNLGGYSMDLKTENIWLEEGLLKNEIREKILHRCEILRYMGDDGISCIFDQLPDHELVDDCGWVLDHDDLDNFQLGITRKN